MPPSPPRYRLPCWTHDRAGVVERDGGHVEGAAVTATAQVNVPALLNATAELSRSRITLPAAREVKLAPARLLIVAPW